MRNISPYDVKSSGIFIHTQVVMCICSVYSHSNANHNFNIQNQIWYVTYVYCKSILVHNNGINGLNCAIYSCWGIIYSTCLQTNVWDAIVCFVLYKFKSNTRYLLHFIYLKVNLKHSSIISGEFPRFWWLLLNNDKQ